MSGTRMLVLFGLMLMVVAPADASVDMYQKAGLHSSQMQSWKLLTRTFMDGLETLTSNLELNTLTLNDTLILAFKETDRHITGLKKMADDLDARLDDLLANNTELNGYEAPIAFQAFISTGGSSPMGVTYLPFKYNDIEINEGNHYSPSTGLFTAPKTGMYWFHATFTCPGGKRETVLKLIKASNSASETIAYMNYYNNQETAATTVVLMHPGDTVGMYPAISTFETWSLDTGSANTFTGYMVADYVDPNYVAPTPAATAQPATVESATTTTVQPTTTTTGAAPAPAPATDSTPSIFLK